MSDAPMVVKPASQVMNEVQVRQFLLTLIPVVTTLGFVKASGFLQALVPLSGIIAQGLVIVWGWLASRKGAVQAESLATKADDNVAVVAGAVKAPSPQ